MRPFEAAVSSSSRGISRVTDHLNTENAALEELLGPGFGDTDRPTSDGSFASAFPALTYALTALIGLLLQQQPVPIRSDLSLQEVQNFLLEDCDEAELRQALGFDPMTLTKPLLEAKTTTVNMFPDVLIPLAQEFIKRLYN